MEETNEKPSLKAAMAAELMLVSGLELESF